MTELRLRNPRWNPGDLESWAECWSNLWAAGVRWEWREGDTAWWPPSGHIIHVDDDQFDALDDYIPLPDTAALLQLWSGVRQCTVDVCDDCELALRGLVDSRCRVPVRVS